MQCFFFCYANIVELTSTLGKKYAQRMIKKRHLASGYRENHLKHEKSIWDIWKYILLFVIWRSRQIKIEQKVVFFICRFQFFFHSVNNEKHFWSCRMQNKNTHNISTTTTTKKKHYVVGIFSTSILKLFTLFVLRFVFFFFIRWEFLFQSFDFQTRNKQNWKFIISVFILRLNWKFMKKSAIIGIQKWFYSNCKMDAHDIQH